GGVPLRGPRPEAVEDLRRGGVDDGSMLSDIEARADEAEGGDLPAKPQEIAVRDGLAVMAAKAGIEQVEVGAQLVGGCIGASLTLERGAEPLPDEGQLPSIWFLDGAGIQRRGIIGQLGFILLNGGRE